MSTNKDFPEAPPAPDSLARGVVSEATAESDPHQAMGGGQPDHPPVPEQPTPNLTAAAPLQAKPTTKLEKPKAAPIFPKGTYGVDFADVDRPTTIDFAEAKRNGAKFALIRKAVCYQDRDRKTYHTRADKAYGKFADDARAAGLVVGAYFFPCFDDHAPSAKAQVQAFLAAAGEIQVGVDLPPVIDVEFPGDGIHATGRTQGQCYTFLLDLIREVKAEIGVTPMIYTSHVQWHDSNGLGGPADLGGFDCPLWIKVPYRLKARSTPDTDAPREPHYGHLAEDRLDLWRMPKPWETAGWWVRQFQGDAVGFPGFANAVDLNDFRLYDTRREDAASDKRYSWVKARLDKALGVQPHGKKLEDLVKAFQKTKGLDEDGVIGLRTFAMLSWVS